MAITFLGSFGYSVGTSGATIPLASNLFDSSGGHPTLQQDDLIVVSLAQSSAATSVPNAMTGYTTAYTAVTANDTNDIGLQTSYKFMGATPDANITFPGSVNSTGVLIPIVHAFRGVHTTTPMDVTATTTSGINGGVPNSPSITPITAGAWILAVGAATDTSANLNTLTNPTGMSTTTAHFRQSAGGGTSNSAGCAHALKVDWLSGAFDPATFGGGATVNTSSWAAATIALRPLVAGAPSTAGNVSVYWF